MLRRKESKKALQRSIIGRRLLDQDRLLEQQRAQDPLVVSALRDSLAFSDQQLAAGNVTWSAGSVLLTIENGRAEVHPRNRVADLPAVPKLREAPAGGFAVGEDLEFRRRDVTGTIRAFRELANSSDAAIRAGALVRVGRNLKKHGAHRQGAGGLQCAAGNGGFYCGLGPCRPRGPLCALQDLRREPSSGGIADRSGSAE